MSNSRFSLTEYFTRIGLHDYHPEPTLACLREITFHHVITFPYQNSRLYQEGKKPAEQRQLASLDTDVVYDEIVNKKMPAYCFQNMSLLREVLTRVGFTLTPHLSKVILEPHKTIDADKIAQHHDSHVVLKVTIDEQDFLVDAGFANESLRQPLPLVAGKHELEADDYLLEEFDDHWRLNSARIDSNGQSYWFSLFRFDKKTASEADITKAHHDLYFLDDMRIRSDLLLYSTVSYSKRKFLCWSAPENNGTFKSFNMDGSIKDSKTFTSEQDVVEFAKQKFSL